MALSSQFDALEFSPLYLPYSKIEAELSPKPRIVAGRNMMVTAGGKLIKRHGTTEISGTTIAGRIDRLWIYETQEVPPKVYLLASVYNGATWAIYYNRMGGGGGQGWVSLGSLRGINQSAYPHELTFSRGLAFIKAYPQNGETLGTVIFDGRDASVKIWGVLGPTLPARMQGGVARLVEEVDAVQTTIKILPTINPGEFFAGAFIWIDNECMFIESMNVNGNEYELTVMRGAPTFPNGTNNTEAAPHAPGAVVRQWANWRSFETVWSHVLLGWEYTYAYKTETGHISNRAPLETDPAKLPSNTGPFSGPHIPKIYVHGHPDIQHVPEIVVYRSKDGGGVWYKIPNPGEEWMKNNQGDVDWVFEDFYRIGVGDWIQAHDDRMLEDANPAPTLTSNSPPPACLAPKITGIDPIEPSSPLTTYARRIWYAIGNTLFFSGDEEIHAGIPEECFPSGLFGNFFRLNDPIVTLTATNGGIFITTYRGIHVLTGSNRETFNIRPLYDNIGGAIGHPRAITTFGNRVALMTHDFRVLLIEDDGSAVILSDPLGSDLTDAEKNGAEFDLDYWADGEKEYLVVAAHRKDNPAESRQWVLDLRLTKQKQEPFWFTPWTIPSVATASGRISETSGQRRLIFAISNGTTSKLVYFDPQAAADSSVYGGSGSISYFFDTYLMTVPVGNHVNTLRRPALTPCVYGFLLARTSFAGDSEPNYYYFLDDAWTTPVAFDFTEIPPRHETTKGYKKLFLPINKVAERLAFRASGNTTFPVEFQTITPVWTPESGA